MVSGPTHANPLMGLNRSAQLYKIVAAANKRVEAAKPPPPPPPRPKVIDLGAGSSTTTAAVPTGKHGPISAAAAATITAAAATITPPPPPPPPPPPAFGAKRTPDGNVASPADLLAHKMEANALMMAQMQQAMAKAKPPPPPYPDPPPYSKVRTVVGGGSPQQQQPLTESLSALLSTPSDVAAATVTPVLLDKTIDTKDSMYTATGGAIDGFQANNGLSGLHHSLLWTLTLIGLLIVLAAIVLIRLYPKVSTTMGGGHQRVPTSDDSGMLDNSFMIGMDDARAALGLEDDEEEEEEVGSTREPPAAAAAPLPPPVVVAAPPPAAKQEGGGKKTRSGAAKRADAAGAAKGREPHHLQDERPVRVGRGRCGEGGGDRCAAEAEGRGAGRVGLSLWSARL